MVIQDWYTRQKRWFDTSPRDSAQPDTLTVKLDPEQEDWPISLLGLRTRAYNALARNGIRSVSQLLQVSEQRLWTMRGIGAMAVSEGDSPGRELVEG